jgi:transposase
MAGQRTTKAPAGVTWSERQIRQHSAGALRYALDVTGATQADAAKWVQRSERTVRDWLAERAAIDLRSVLRSGRLRRAFLRYLTVCDQRVRKTLPRIARARKGHY